MSERALIFFVVMVPIMGYYYFFRYKRHGDTNGWWWFAGAVILIGFANGAFDPRTSHGNNCYTEWDGFSNSTVCD